MRETATLHLLLFLAVAFTTTSSCTQIILASFHPSYSIQLPADHFRAHQYVRSSSFWMKHNNMNEQSSAEGGSNNISRSPAKRIKMEETQHQEQAPSSSSSTKGPIYITVGPQCSGKTTILKQLFGGTVEHDVEYTLLDQEPATGSVNEQQQQLKGLDITIDDQALVYLSLPSPLYLTHPCIYSDTPGMKETCAELRNVTVFGSTILDRIIEKSMDEVLWVMQRLIGVIDAEFFAKRIRNDDDDNNEVDDEEDDLETTAKSPETKKVPRTAQDDLIDAVEHIIKTKNAEGITNLLPETVDLFVVESIFRPRPFNLIERFAKEHLDELTNTTPNGNATVTLSALEAAQSKLKSLSINSNQYPSTDPLSWGNTNTRPREMTTAFEAAERSQRPIHFIVYGGLEACDQIRDHTFQIDADLTLCLPKTNRLTLLQRNINRFIETGRYIPCMAIADALERVNSMVGSAVVEANKGEDGAISSERARDAKFRLDYELAKMAGYRLHPDRTVSSLGSSNSHSPRGGGRGGNNRSGGRGRGNYNRGRNNSSNYGRGDSNRNQDYPRGGSNAYDGRRGGRAGGRSYLQDPSGRGYNNQGGNYNRHADGERGGFYERQGRGRGGPYDSRGGQQGRYGGRSYFDDDGRQHQRGRGRGRARY